MFGVAAPNSSGKPQEVSLECVMSCNSDEIFLSAQPSTGNKAPDQRKRRTLCDLPWTTNYFIGDVNKRPGQLSDKERTAIYKDHSAEFQENQKEYKAEKLGKEKIRSSTKGGNWRDEQEQLVALELKYMGMLTAAQQKPRRRIEVEEVKILGQKEQRVWLVLSEPDKLEGYSWIARKTIQSVSDITTSMLCVQLGCTVVTHCHHTGLQSACMQSCLNSTNSRRCSATTALAATC